MRWGRRSTAVKITYESHDSRLLQECGIYNMLKFLCWIMRWRTLIFWEDWRCWMTRRLSFLASLTNLHTASRPSDPYLKLLRQLNWWMLRGKKTFHLWGMVRQSSFLYIGEMKVNWVKLASLVENDTAGDIVSSRSRFSVLLPSRRENTSTSTCFKKIYNQKFHWFRREGMKSRSVITIDENVYN